MNSLVGFGSVAAFGISMVRPILKAEIEFSSDVAGWFNLPLLVSILSDS